MNGMLSSFTNGSKQEVSFISLEWNSMETNLNLFIGLFRSCANACMLVILTVSFFLLLSFSRVCMSYCTLNRRRHYPGDGNSCRHRQFRCPTWWQFKWTLTNLLCPVRCQFYDHKTHRRAAGSILKYGLTPWSPAENHDTPYSLKQSLLKITSNWKNLITLSKSHLW